MQYEYHLILPSIICVYRFDHLFLPRIYFLTVHHHYKDEMVDIIMADWHMQKFFTEGKNGLGDSGKSMMFTKNTKEWQVGFQIKHGRL